MKQRPIPFLAVADILALFQIAVGAVIVRAVPERRWLRLASIAVRAKLMLRRGWAAAQTAHLGHWISADEIAQRPEVLLERYLAHRRLAKLHVLRCRQPDDWPVSTRIEGREHLDAALARGAGVILWVTPMVFGPLLTKIALYRGGVACTHLSRYSHGFSKSRLGAWLLNPVLTSVEARFLGERVVIGPDGSVHAAMRRLTARLRANGIVSVSVGAQGVGAVELPFMRGSLWLATGVVGLARQTGAVLLPVFTERESDGGFVTVIGAPLSAPPQLERREADLAIAGQLAEALEARVRQRPDQFSWDYDVLRAPSPS